MAQQRVIVRRLPAVETLGSVGVICTDKTGTLTRNEMTVVRLLLPEMDLDVSGVGYTPKGTITRDGQALTEESRSQVIDLVTVGALCNDAHLSEREGAWSIIGDPTEGALIPLAYKAGIDVEQSLDEWELIDEVPFDPRFRYMAMLRRHHDGRVRVFCKGAPEVIIELTGERNAHWQHRIHEAALEGQRVLALAHADVPQETRRIAMDDISGSLGLVGMVALLDPPRPEAKDAVEACQEAGIRVIMITGDHEVTAAAIGRSLGLSAE